MVNLFDRAFDSIKGKNKVLAKLKMYSLMRFFIRVAANTALPLYFKVTGSNKKYMLDGNANNGGRLVVSLTSFPARIDKVWLVVETILRQRLKPDAIILWLSAEQFPSLDILPKRLLKQRERGLDIRLVNGDLRAHKKYYYTLKEYPGDILITVDDDIFYPSDTLQELVKWHNTFPRAVIARYGYKIRKEGETIAPYKEWRSTYKQEVPGYEVFFGSGGGTLFPPSALPDDTVNEALFRKLCFYADDVWLNTMCRLGNTEIFKTRERLCSILPVAIKNNVSLSTTNLQGNMNDEQIQNVRNHYISTTGTDLYK